MLLVKKLTVATPLAFVVLVGEENCPPPVLLQVTTLPALLTALLFASASWAVIATGAPAIGLFVLAVTAYFVPGPGTVVMIWLVPVRLDPSVAVTVCPVAETLWVVKSTVVVPFTSVVLVPLAKLPPVPVLLQVTTTPAVATGFEFASASCATIFTVSPAMTLERTAPTMYFAAAPTKVVIFGLVPVKFVLSVAMTV